MSIGAALMYLRKTGWKIKMTTSDDDKCAFAFIANKSGLGIGSFGLFGYGNTPQIAIDNLMAECKLFSEKAVKESKEE